jgi:1,4-dihydroxy-6-naphthoate synthase
MSHLTLGYSPCPNDCYIFYGLAHDRIQPKLDWRIVLDDVEALNRSAERGDLDVTKLSYHAYGHVADRYVMLAGGGALGRGVGPLIVTREPLADLSGRRVAVPGGLTTANLLLELSQAEDIDTLELRYDRIMPAVAAGEVDAGLIIHESRFTYRRHGLRKFLDLGSWWERETGLPIPLGGIAARRDLGSERLGQIETAVRASLAYADAHPHETDTYVAEHAQEMDAAVRRQHIELYVNDFSRDLGTEGKGAVQALLQRARDRGLIPAWHRPLFVEEAPREGERPAAGTSEA